MYSLQRHQKGLPAAECGVAKSLPRCSASLLGLGSVVLKALLDVGQPLHSRAAT